MHELIGDSAQEPFAQARVTITAHNDDVGLTAPSLGDDGAGMVSMAGLYVAKRCVDPMVLQVSLEFIADHLLKAAGNSLAGLDHCNGARFV